MEVEMVVDMAIEAMEKKLDNADVELSVEAIADIRDIIEQELEDGRYK